MRAARLVALFAFVVLPFAAVAADYPAPKQGEWIARDFKFHTGEVMPEVKLAYTTIGEPSGEPVLVLHGTSQRAGAMLTPVFAGELFGAGQPLDASKYFIIIPDSLGHGGSTKPSDGLRGKFPRYNYDDMVEAQYRLRQRRAWHQARAADHRQLDGRHACLAVGRELSRLAWTRWCRWQSQPTAMASAQLDDAAPDDRNDPPRSRLRRWRLHHAAAIR